MTREEQYKAWLENGYRMMNVYNEIPKPEGGGSDGVIPLGSFGEINYKQWSKGSDEYKKWLQANEKENPCMMGTSRKIPCEPGRIGPLTQPEGFDYYEWMMESLGYASNKAIRDYLKNTQEISISKLKEIRDTIDHPPHYTQGKIEVWDFIIDQGLDFLLGNVIKYVCRAGRKGNRLEDLRKAEAYIRKAIKNEGGNK